MGHHTIGNEARAIQKERKRGTEVRERSEGSQDSNKFRRSR